LMGYLEIRPAPLKFKITGLQFGSKPIEAINYSEAGVQLSRPLVLYDPANYGEWVPNATAEDRIGYIKPSLVTVTLGNTALNMDQHFTVRCENNTDVTSGTNYAKVFVEGVAGTAYEGIATLYDHAEFVIGRKVSNLFVYDWSEQIDRLIANPSGNDSVNLTYPLGATATFNKAATATAYTALEWRLNGTKVEGAVDSYSLKLESKGMSTLTLLATKGGKLYSTTFYITVVDNNG